MLFMTDIVLNHTSTNSPLIQQDLSITFNNSNTPQLIPAIELDLLLQQLSNQLEEAVSTLEQVNRTVNDHVNCMI